MRYLLRFSLLLTVVAALNGCGKSNMKHSSAGTDTLYSPRYANGFEIMAAEGCDSSSIVRIKNPWQGAHNVEIEMFLARGGEHAPEGFKGIVVDAPLRSVVCMSSSYVAFIDAVGCIDAVKGVSGARFITNPTIRGRYKADSVKDVGYDTNLNYELIASLHPDVVMIYGVAGENTRLCDKMRELGIRVIYIGDYIEQSPLGKAEWVVALGEMFNRRDRAQTLFARVESDYNAQKARVADVAVRPSVMLNAPWRDTWFVPGDRSYMVRLINDAGGEYACRGDDSEISRPISGESAFVLASKSEVWLNPNQVSTIAELVALNPNFGSIPPVTNGRVYNNTRRNTADGGSDFWESGAVYPNIVLRDMIHILQPSLATDTTELYYFKKLQ